MSVDISNLTTLREGVYWIMLNVVICFCFVWLLLVLVILNKLDIKLERFTICKNLGFVAENVLPVLGNACFLPIISIILDVYVCDKAHGDKPYSFSDSFLARDCY
jgi:hypothetical protein